MISYIIPFRYTPERYRNLNIVLNHIKNIQGLEIILVEQDKYQHIKHFNNNIAVRHIFIEKDGLFNKSHAMNVGIRYANSNIIILGDSDIIIDYKQLIDSIDTLTKEQLDFICPYDKFINLTEQETQLPIPKILQIQKVDRGEETDEINMYGGKVDVPNMCSGICIFTKPALNKINYYNEDFDGWGGEDDFLEYKVKDFLKYKRTNGNIYHLYHAKSEVYQAPYERNLKMIIDYKNLPTLEDKLRVININRNNIGRKNKFVK